MLFLLIRRNLKRCPQPPTTKYSTSKNLSNCILSYVPSDPAYQYKHSNHTLETCYIAPPISHALSEKIHPSTISRKCTHFKGNTSCLLNHNTGMIPGDDLVLSAIYPPYPFSNAGRASSRTSTERVTICFKVPDIEIPCL